MFDKFQNILVLNLYIGRLTFLALCKLMLMNLFEKKCESYVKTKNGTMIVVHCISILA